MHFRLYSIHMSALICFSFVAFYYCFLSFPQSRSIFALFSNHSPDLRVQHSLPSLFPDWCVRTKKGWYERCVVVSCFAGIWIGWTSRGMILQEPKVKQSGMQTCVVCYGLLRPWQFGSEHAGLSFTNITREQYSTENTQAEIEHWQYRTQKPLLYKKD